MPEPHRHFDEKYDLSSGRVLLSGAQAVVRLLLMQSALDRNAGLSTAGYVTGYRGSPLANLESAFATAVRQVAANDIIFQPAINEDLAATALWGAQQAELRGDGRYDGVFGLWYGKGPGVDRSGDALRHANHAGTSRHGGVLALMGDDHTCESSTSAHQSEFAFIDAMIPILSPANVQEILDYGLIGYALSRYAGAWVGLKCVKDTAESTATVDGRLERIGIRIPTAEDFELPSGGLNIRIQDQPLAKELRLHNDKQNAILAFQRANGFNQLIWPGGNAPKVGIVSSGKSYSDTRQALHDIGVDRKRADGLGLALLKVAMPWPMEPESMRRFAKGLDSILVIEEKRAIIEPQLKEILYNADRRPSIYGKRDEHGQWLLPSTGGLEVIDIAEAILRTLKKHNNEDVAFFENALGKTLQQRQRRPRQPEPISREAYFCAGCPHNRSTVIPDDARAYAGIGCHYMAQWMDRETEGFTQMGAEGANWIGEAPFSNRQHVFQNVGDGTYIHSGSLAIRAAVASGTTITFKILYNDAVAMTGGQKLEGGKSVLQMARETKAEGAQDVAIVTENVNAYRGQTLPDGVRIYARDKLEDVQLRFQKTPGVTVIIYDQTCAAEKRRRRKRGFLPQSDTRVFINPLVCEGCGDCGAVSNCVGILPLETEFGCKREIDQSACNFDMSCIDGYCPSFVTLKGAEVRGSQISDAAMASLIAGDNTPDPDVRKREGSTAILAAGVGGTGIVTISAVLGQAAYLDGKAFGGIDVTGLAQKGGSVVCHMRISDKPEDIFCIPVGTERADLIIGGDVVVTASNKVLDAMRPGETGVVLSNHETPTGDFTRDPDAAVPSQDLLDRIRERLAGAPLFDVDVQSLARTALGNSVYANMILLGAAYQSGFIPLRAQAIEQAIEVIGVAAETNVSAFRLGRLVVHEPIKLNAHIEQLDCSPKAGIGKTLQERIDIRVEELGQYQNAQLAERFRSVVDTVAAAEKARVGRIGGLTDAVASSFFKLLAVKDEYEVARLFTDGRFDEYLSNNFSDPGQLSFHFFPPGFRPKKGQATGGRKFAFGGFWMKPVLGSLASMRILRGSWLDVFGYSGERRNEHTFVLEFEGIVDEIVGRLTPENHTQAIELARLPEKIRGFGHVKAASAERVRKELNQKFTVFCKEPGVPKKVDKSPQKAIVS